MEDKEYKLVSLQLFIVLPDGRMLCRRASGRGALTPSPWQISMYRVSNFARTHDLASSLRVHMSTAYGINLDKVKHAFRKAFRHERSSYTAVDVVTLWLMDRVILRETGYYEIMPLHIDDIFKRHIKDQASFEPLALDMLDAAVQQGEFEECPEPIQSSLP